MDRIEIPGSPGIEIDILLRHPLADFRKAGANLPGLGFFHHARFPDGGAGRTKPTFPARTVTWSWLNTALSVVIIRIPPRSILRLTCERQLIVSPTLTVPRNSSSWVTWTVPPGKEDPSARADMASAVRASGGTSRSRW